MEEATPPSPPLADRVGLRASEDKAAGLRIAIPAALLAFALAARLAMLFTLEGKPFVAEPILDSKAYDDWGREIAERSFWGDRAFYQDPLYPYGLGVFYRTFGRRLVAVKVLQALLGVLGLWFLFEASRRAAGTAAAVATLGIAVLYRTTAFYDVVLLKEFLGPFFLEAAFLAGVLALQQGRWWWWLLTGLAVGLAALVRGNLIVLAPALAVAFLLMKERRGAGLVLAGAAVAILPCTIRNAAVAREFVVTTTQLGPNLYTGNNPDNWTGRYVPPPFVRAGTPEFEEQDFRREAERRRVGATLSAGAVSAYWRGEALAAMRAWPWQFAGATFRRTMLLTNDWEVPDNFNIAFMRRFSWALDLPWLTFGIVWPLAAAGLYLTWIERSKHVLAYVLLGGALAPVAFFFVFDRYRLPAVPILFFFAGYAAVKLYEMRRWKMRRVPAAAVIVAIAALVHANLPASVYGVGDTGFRSQHRNLAKWHVDHGSPMQAAREMERFFQLWPEGKQHRESATFAAECWLAAGRVPDALPLHLGVNDHAGAARCYLKLRDPASAATQFALAIAASPGDVDLRLEHAAAQSAAGQKLEALDGLARAAEAFPAEPGPHLGRARIYRNLSMWREAAAAAGEAIKRAPRRLGEAEEIREEARKKMSHKP